VSVADYNACLDLILDILQSEGESIDITDNFEDFGFDDFQESSLLNPSREVK
jgi:hypothetical protein